MKRLVLVMLCACGGGAAAPRPAPTAPTKPIVTPPAPAGTAQAAELTGVIKKLRVEGGQRTQVEAALASALGKPVGSDELRAALARVIHVEGVADVTVKAVQLADGIELVVEVTGYPVLKKLVAIEAGGKALSLGIAAPTLDGPLDPQRVQTLAQMLRDRYVTTGYFDADATWKSSPVAGGVEVTIEVTPGPLSAIDAVSFPGSTLPKQDLDAAVAKWLVVGQPAVEERIAAAAQAISAYYWDKGYANVMVREPKITAGRIALAFTITEGPQFKMGAIEIRGVPAADRPKYLALFGVKQGDLFNRSAIASGRDKLITAFDPTGQRGVNVLPLTKVDLPNKRIALTVEVTGIDP